MAISQVGENTILKPSKINEIINEITKKPDIDMIFSVGDITRDYQTLNEALEDISKKYQKAYKETQSKFKIELYRGEFVMSEQIICDGIDLSWIEIYDVAAPVFQLYLSINRTSITKNIEGRYPVFAAINGGRLPYISGLNPSFDTSTENNPIDFIYCSGAGSSSLSGSITTRNDAGGNISGYAVYSRDGAVISANTISMDASFLPSRGLVSDFGIINIGGKGAVNSVIRAAGSSIYTSNGGTINIGDSVSISGNITATFGGRIITYSSPITGNVSVAFGSYCSFLIGSIIDGNVTVSSGGIVLVGTVTGSLSQSANIITSNGIIFQ